MAERLFRLLNIVDSWLFPEKITCLCCDSALGDDEQDPPVSIRPLPLFPMPTSRVN